MRRRYWLVGVAALGLCGLLLTGGCQRLEHIEVNGERRGYRLHLPHPAPEGPMPLLLALHQFSDTARGTERMTGFNRVADAEGFVVAYPQGKMRIWDTDSDRDVQFLLQLITHLSEQYEIDPERIFMTGASAGAVMAQYFASTTAVLAGIAPVMGTLTEEEAAKWQVSRNVPALLMHGTADPVIAFDGGETFAGPGRPRPVFLSAPDNAAWWARQNGCGETGALEVAEGYSVLRFDCGPEQGPVWFYTIEEGGHTWPGGKNRYPRFIVGDTSNALDASRTIWTFFEGLRAE